MRAPLVEHRRSHREHGARAAFKLNFHQLQAIEFARLARARIAEHATCKRASHRRWLCKEIARLRAREEWHARRVRDVVSPAVQALADEALFHFRRSHTHRDQRERELACARFRDALRRAGEQYGAEREREQARAKQQLAAESENAPQHGAAGRGGD